MVLTSKLSADFLTPWIVVQTNVSWLAGSIIDENPNGRSGVLEHAGRRRTEHLRGTWPDPDPGHSTLSQGRRAAGAVDRRFRRGPGTHACFAARRRRLPGRRRRGRSARQRHHNERLALLQGWPVGDCLADLPGRCFRTMQLSDAPRTQGTSARWEETVNNRCGFGQGAGEWTELNLPYYLLDALLLECRHVDDVAEAHIAVDDLRVRLVDVLDVRAAVVLGAEQTKSLWFQNHFDASIFFVAEGFVSVWCFFQGKAMCNDKGGINFADFDLFQKRFCVTLDMRLSGFDG
jgi:hypothetical protein